VIATNTGRRLDVMSNEVFACVALGLLQIDSVDISSLNQKKNQHVFKYKFWCWSLLLLALAAIRETAPLSGVRGPIGTLPAKSQIMHDHAATGAGLRTIHPTGCIILLTAEVLFKSSGISHPSLNVAHRIKL
jgi:hypothetical protein